MDFISSHTPIFYFIQPLWRDEAFSVLLSQNSLVKIIKLTAGDFNPPLYYLLLNLWMQFFGSSEIVVRALSFIIHVVLIYFVAEFFKKNYKLPNWKLYLLLSLIFLNPMLLYFAFEARMYSLLTLFSFLCFYFLAKKNYKWLTIISILGMYTHYYFAFVLLSCFLFIVIRKRKMLPEFRKRILIVFLFFLPWGIVALNQLKNTGSTWFYPVDANLIASLLGSLYLGFEGTPPSLWTFSRIFSLLLAIFIFYYLLSVKKTKKESDLASFFLLLLFVPLALVIGISFSKRIFVPRYVIFTVLPLICLFFLGVSALKSKMSSYLILVLNLVFVVGFNLYFVGYHAKVDFKRTLSEIYLDFKNDDNRLIVSQTPLSFFEVSYYAKSKKNVFLYNPGNEELLPYVGRILIPREKWINDFPYGKIVYLIADNGTFTKIQN